jgi:hypothetical protein
MAHQLGRGRFGGFTAIGLDDGDVSPRHVTLRETPENLMRFQQRLLFVAALDLSDDQFRRQVRNRRQGTVTGTQDLDPGS